LPYPGRGVPCPSLSPVSSVPDDYYEERGLVIDEDRDDSRRGSPPSPSSGEPLPPLNAALEPAVGGQLEPLDLSLGSVRGSPIGEHGSNRSYLLSPGLRFSAVFGYILCLSSFSAEPETSFVRASKRVRPSSTIIAARGVRRHPLLSRAARKMPFQAPFSDSEEEDEEDHNSGLPSPDGAEP
jgi:hypothetical protein